MVLLASACGKSASSTVTADGAVDAGTADADGPADAAADEGTADAACVAGSWDAGAAAVATDNAGTLIFAQGWTTGFPRNETGLFRAFFFRPGQLLYPPLGREDWAVVGQGLITEVPGVCNVTTAGACTVWTTGCDIPAAPTCPAPQAGLLTIGNSSTGDADEGELRPNPDGTYAPEQWLTSSTSDTTPAPPFFDARDQMSVTAAGGDVPSFQLIVQVPGCVALTQPQPQPADGGTGYPAVYTIATGQDLQLSWTGGEAEATVGLDLVQNLSNGNFIDVSCAFPASDGQGVIPQAALAGLTGTGGWFTIYQQRSRSEQRGSFQIELDFRNLGGAGTTPDGGACPANSGYVTYQ
jgi:hypothetical protein